MADGKIHMPGGFGGLMRYDEEVKSKFSMKPSYVIGLIVLIILFVLFLKLFFGVPTVATPTG